MSEIEEIARAMCAVLNEDPDKIYRGKPYWLSCGASAELARRALLSLNWQRVPPSHIVVPREPTGALDCGNCLNCLRDKRDAATGLPAARVRMVVCSNCGNKRCPRATDHNLTCTNSNEPGQPGSDYALTASLTQEGET